MTDANVIPLYRDTMSILHVQGNVLKSSFVTVDYLSTVGSLLPNLRTHLSNYLFVLDDPSHPAYAEYDHLPDYITHLYKDDDDKFSVKGPTQHIVILERIPGAQKNGRPCMDCALAQYINQQLVRDIEHSDTVIVLNAAVRSAPSRKPAPVVMGMHKEKQMTATLIAIRGSGFVHANISVAGYVNDPAKEIDSRHVVILYDHQYPDYELVCDWGDASVEKPNTQILPVRGIPTTQLGTAMTNEILSRAHDFDRDGIILLRSLNGDAIVT